MQFFNEFYVSDAITKATQAFKTFEKAVKALQDEVESKINVIEIANSLSDSQISADVQTTIINLYRSILARCEWLA